MRRPGLGLGLGGRLGEDGLEVARYRGAVRFEHGVERVPVAEAGHLSDSRPVFCAFGQLVPLRIVQVLKPVLDIAQEYIGC